MSSDVNPLPVPPPKLWNTKKPYQLAFIEPLSAAMSSLKRITLDTRRNSSYNPDTSAAASTNCNAGPALSPGLIPDHQSHPQKHIACGYAKTHQLNETAIRSSLSLIRKISCAFNTNLEQCYTKMERGAKVQKVFLNRKGECSPRYSFIRRETRQLLLYKISSDNHADNNDLDQNTYLTTLQSNANTKNLRSLSAIDMRTIKEARSLDQKLACARFGVKWRYLQISYEPRKLLIINHGSQFNLDTLILAFDSTDMCRTWLDGLNTLVRDSLFASYSLLVERWLRKEFYAIVNPQTNHVTVKEFKPFIQQRLQFKITSKALQSLTEERMGYEAFASAYRRLVHVNSDSIINNEEKCSEVFSAYLKDIDVARDVTQPHLTVHEFMDYLFSKENSVWDPQNDVVLQDMNQPLCNYWIASSHNTYLTGDQLKSESSLEAYARALLMGCRCIELDVWDGQKKNNADAEIVIYHGYTMTSKLNLRDVLFTIREYAFVTSDYPVILSIEDNCTLGMQRQLAHDLKEILGEFLLVVPLDKDERQLPSPEQLKHKIVVKHKKLPDESERAQSVASTSSLDDSFQDQDILSKPGIIKRGLLQLQDAESHEWHPHIFVLFSDRLCYTSDMNLLIAAATNGSITNFESDGQSLASNFQSQLSTPLNAAQRATDDENADQQEYESGSNANQNNVDELHLTEEWFHGKISRDEAVAWLKSNTELGDGLFLVRESTTFVGDYSLSFLHCNEVHHCRIKSALSHGAKHYYLLECKQMDTLYELISYYQEHQLTTPKFRAKLAIPCPQPSPHLGQPWFAGDIDRQKSEDMLNSHPLDGSFLIRFSGSGDNVFTLSFRVDGLIKHGRLKQEGRMFVVGSHQFENLNLMVEYYSTHEFYHGISLKFPVNAEAIENYSREVLNAPQGCYLDLQNIDNKHFFVRAKSAYVATDPKTELSFPAGAIICVVQNEVGFWWKGVYKGRQGLIPVDHVEPLLQNITDGLTGEGLGSGWIDLTRSRVEILDVADKENVLKLVHGLSHPDIHECIIASDSREDFMDWVNALQETIRGANDKAIQLKHREKCLKIASELSNLVIYCQAVQFNPDRIPGYYFEMISFSDSKLDKYVEKGLAKFNLVQLSRVYPNASRLTSANFNPIPMWCCGVQMVALNYQMPDKAMQLNQGKFLANGMCGYVLKPPSLRHLANVDSDKVGSLPSQSFITVTIEVIAGRHLCRKDRGKGIVSPVVEIEVLGLACDSKSKRTKTVSCDGLHPVWEERFVFDVHYPELSLIRFYVEEGDFVKTDPFIGQTVFPIDCLRTGYRSVPLKNAYSEELELSSLLIHLDIKKQKSLCKSDTVPIPPPDLQSYAALSGAENGQMEHVQNKKKVDKTRITPTFGLAVSEDTGSDSTYPLEKKKTSILRMFKRGAK